MSNPILSTNVALLRIGNTINALREEEEEHRLRGTLTAPDVLGYRLQIQALETAYAELDRQTDSCDEGTFQRLLETGIQMPRPEAQMVTTTIEDLRNALDAAAEFDDLNGTTLIHLISTLSTIRAEVTVDGQIQRIIHTCHRPAGS